MARTLTIAAAQVGAVHRTSPRPETLARLISLLQTAATKGAKLVVYPETTLTTFFPRYLINDPTELSSFYEHSPDISTDPATAALFTRARELGVDICVGYGEMTPEGVPFNTCIYYSASLGSIVKKYRKSHLPGTVEPFPGSDPDTTVQQLEKRYFREGDTGFGAFRAPDLVQGAVMKKKEKNDDDKKGGEVEEEETADGKGDPIMGMLICNDRRWPEAWRCYGLQGTELVLCGYNSTAWAPELWGFEEEGKEEEEDGETKKMTLTPEKAREDAYFHHKLVMQANSYMNSCFSVCAARAGVDDGKFPLIGGSCIVSPMGKILAQAEGEGDEVVVAEVDLAECRPGKETTFNFAKHRRTELYGRIVEQKGVKEPELLE